MKMHLILSLAIALMVASHSDGQEKRDYNWLMGLPPNNPGNQSGGTRIDFNTTPPTISFFNVPFGFVANTAISDAAGNLLFYSNGCFVANRNNQIMPNGEGINPGFMYDQWCEQGLGYPAHQGILALPWPGNPNQYALIHYRSSDTGNHTHSELLYSTVDMSLDNGLGDVTAKNQLLAIAFFASNLTAVRHGNGRDWWIIAPVQHSKIYYKFLLSPEGFSGPFVQEFGKVWSLAYGGAQDCFSPNGEKYIRMAAIGAGCQIADFDRCTGGFSNAVNLSFQSDTIYSCGCAVSSNNRFLYIPAYRKVYQFDLEASDIAASRVLLDTWDGTQAPLSANFFQAMLAPDGKIYMTAANGVWVLHVVHHPNEPGLACDFEQHGVELPTINDFPIPNFPHFRLYDWPDSPCDTLGIDAPARGVAAPASASGPLRLLPNPVETGQPLRLEAGDLFDPNDQLLILNALGQTYRKVNLQHGASQLYLDTGGLLPGVYWAVLLRAGGQRQVGKFVVQSM